MTETATLVQEGLPQFCPTTNFYQCSDGRYLLVTIPSVGANALLNQFGVVVPIAKSHLPDRADVFLADEHAVVLDADGDPSNGMTPLAQFEHPAGFAEVLAELGYELTEPPTD